SWLRERGESMMNSLRGGIDSARTVVVGAVETMRDAIRDDGLRGAADLLVSAGRSITSGLAEGIRNSEAVNTAVNAVRGIAGRVIDAANNALNRRNPSMVFVDIGESIPEGSAIGINNAAYMVYNAMESLFDGVIDEAEHGADEGGEQGK